MNDLALAAYVVARAAYRRQHRRLLSSVREFLRGEVVKDVAVGVRWSSAWPTLLGGVALTIGAIFGSLGRLLPVVAWLVLGFGLLAIGWIATPAILVVSTADEVFVLQGRRRTYEPVAILERHDRSSWVSDREIATDVYGSARSGDGTSSDHDASLERDRHRAQYV